MARVKKGVKEEPIEIPQETEEKINEIVSETESQTVSENENERVEPVEVPVKSQEQIAEEIRLKKRAESLSISRGKTAKTKIIQNSILKKKAKLFDDYLNHKLVYEDMVEAGFRFAPKVEPVKEKIVEKIIYVPQNKPEKPKKLTPQEIYDMLNM